MIQMSLKAKGFRKQRFVSHSLKESEENILRKIKIKNMFSYNNNLNICDNVSHSLLHPNYH